ncbi:MAG: 50S ribosomal protein L16 [Candidatus Magasanikbacteria bacterium CG10_big_fil_rev_8_21_14_0_10_40_10]|uniref:Large ribosomal subunit protein uL16 n=1 Tax=Candidatus Magasanikbacteria bacterium CG10_big_fil_rev_8_21_14_0_10_40_10 TaxID=1974648 RepID=A0A2M6W583_9BACT|nr:MAG: 50S ribosomal protein L16 [Candidatus Magasanikbacteria bacterium CG10_big_fil_rev_8_21_14_0_10_40_10]
MLLPKKVLHRKWHKGRRRNKGVATRINAVAFGAFGLKSLDYGWVTSRQIEACRRVLTRYVRKSGKIWIRVFPDKPVTKKGNETPMGGGKGSPDHYVAVIKPGTVLFEMGGVEEDKAREAINFAGHKLGIRTKFVKKI